MKNLQYFVLALVTALFLAACSGGGGPAPQVEEEPEVQPQINVEISASKTRVLFGEEINLVAEVEYEGSDSIAYLWLSDHGELSNADEAQVVWKAPSEQGTFRIHLTVVVGAAIKTTSIDITVETDADMSFNLRGISPKYSYVGLGGEVHLEVDAGGYLADEVTYEWSYDHVETDGQPGHLTSEAGSTTTFKAPVVEGGGHQIRVTAAHEGVVLGTTEAFVTVGLCDQGDYTDSASPCVITNVFQLQEIGISAERLSGHYRLGSDINATIAQDWHSGAGFQPIGLEYVQHHSLDTEAGGFSGTFDGAGYTIRNLHMHWPEQHQVGLFLLLVEGATVESLTIADAEIHGKLQVGSIAGRINGAVVRDVHLADVDIHGQGYYEFGYPRGSGGIAGIATNATLEHITLEKVSVESMSHPVGGVSGRAIGNTTIQNIEMGFIDLHAAEDYSGGVTASTTLGVQIKSVNGSNINITNDAMDGVGGVVGDNHGLISDVEISAVNIQANADWIGGIAGRNASGGKIMSAIISHSIIAGSDLYSSAIGGLVGLNRSGTITRSGVVETSVVGHERVGGAIGEVTNDAVVKETYVYGPSQTLHSSGDYVGGFAGIITGRSSVNDSYVILEKVTSDGNFLGGFAGALEENSGVTNAYIHAEVLTGQGTTNTSAFIGKTTDSAIAASFWLSQHEQWGPFEYEPGTFELSDADMKSVASFTSRGWTFGPASVATWQMPPTHVDGTHSPDLVNNSRY